MHGGGEGQGVGEMWGAGGGGGGGGKRAAVEYQWLRQTNTLEPNNLPSNEQTAWHRGLSWLWTRYEQTAIFRSTLLLLRTHRMKAESNSSPSGVQSRPSWRRRAHSPARAESPSPPCRRGHLSTRHRPTARAFHRTRHPLLPAPCRRVGRPGSTRRAFCR